MRAAGVQLPVWGSRVEPSENISCIRQSGELIVAVLQALFKNLPSRIYNSGPVKGGIALAKTVRGLLCLKRMPQC